MLESQQGTIQRIEWELLQAKTDANNLRTLLTRKQKPRSQSPKSGKARPRSASNGVDSEDDYIIDADADEEDASIELFDADKAANSRDKCPPRPVREQSRRIRRTCSAVSMDLNAAQKQALDRRLKLEEERNEEIVRAANQEYSQNEGVRTGTYLKDTEFYMGLDAYNGMPVAAGELELFKMMEFEFCGGENADDMFTTFNYGGLETTLRLEWLYVVDPERGEQELARLGLSEYPGLVPMKDHDGALFPKRDNGRPRPLESFVTHEMAERAKLRKAEVVGLRLHTGPSYMHIVRFE